MAKSGPMSRKALVLKLGVAVALMGVLVWKVDWQESLRTLLGISIPWIPVLLLISVVLNLLSCIKWQLFLRARGNEVPLLRLFGLYMVGYFFNNFMPGSVGGDVVRGYVLGRELGSQSSSFGSVFLERFTGFIALLGMALLAAAVNPGVLRTRGLMVFMGLMACLFIGMIAFLLLKPVQRIFIRVLGFLPEKLAGKLRKFLDVVFFFQDKPGVLGVAMFWSLLFHIMTIVNTQACCNSIRVPAGFLDLAVLVPLILLVSAIPVSMNSIGIMEGSFVFFLGMAGVSPSAALSVSLVLRAKNLVMAMVGGLIFAVWHRMPGGPPASVLPPDEGKAGS